MSNSLLDRSLDDISRQQSSHSRRGGRGAGAGGRGSRDHGSGSGSGNGRSSPYSVSMTLNRLCTAHNGTAAAAIQAGMLTVRRRSAETESQGRLRRRCRACWTRRRMEARPLQDGQARLRRRRRRGRQHEWAPAKQKSRPCPRGRAEVHPPQDHKPALRGLGGRAGGAPHADIHRSGASPSRPASAPTHARLICASIHTGPLCPDWPAGPRQRKGDQSSHQSTLGPASFVPCTRLLVAVLLQAGPESTARCVERCHAPSEKPKASLDGRSAPAGRAAHAHTHTHTHTHGLPRLAYTHACCLSCDLSTTLLHHRDPSPCLLL
jgi:hypothetical protein